MPLRKGEPVADAIHELVHFGTKKRPMKQIIAIAESNHRRRAKGGGITRRASGGGLITDLGADQTIAAPLTQTRAASLSPMQRGYVGQYDQMPDEKLQEMALRYSGSPQGDTAQRILMARRMGQAQRPAVAPPADDQDEGLGLPEPVRTAPINLQQQGGMRRGGGITRFASGGTERKHRAKDGPVDYSKPQPGDVVPGTTNRRASYETPGNARWFHERNDAALNEDFRKMLSPVSGLADAFSGLGDGMHWGDDLGEDARAIGRHVYNAVIPRAASSLEGAADYAGRTAGRYPAYIKNFSQGLINYLNNKNHGLAQADTPQGSDPDHGYPDWHQPGAAPDTLPLLHTGRAFRGTEIGGADLESPEPWKTPAGRDADKKQAAYRAALAAADADPQFQRIMQHFIFPEEDFQHGALPGDSARGTNLGLNFRNDGDQLRALGLQNDQDLYNDLTPRMAEAVYWNQYYNRPGASLRGVPAAKAAEIMNARVLGGPDLANMGSLADMRAAETAHLRHAGDPRYWKEHLQREDRLGNFEAGTSGDEPLPADFDGIAPANRPVIPPTPNQHIPPDVTNTPDRTGYFYGLDTHEPLPPEKGPAPIDKDGPPLLAQESTTGTGGLRLRDLAGDIARAGFARYGLGRVQKLPKPLGHFKGPDIAPTKDLVKKNAGPGVVQTPNLNSLISGDNDMDELPPPNLRRGGITKLAGGGDPMGISGSAASPWWERAEQRNESGFLRGSTPGRADKLTTTSPAGAYIIPADVVAGLGEGNSLAGAAIMDRILESGPWGIHVNRMRDSGPPEARSSLPRQYDDGGEDYSGEGSSDRGYASGGRLHRDPGGTIDPTRRTAPVDTSQVSNPGLFSFLGPSSSWENQIGSAIAGQIFPGGGMVYDAFASALPGLRQMDANTQVDSATTDHSTWLGKVFHGLTDIGNEVGSAIGSSPSVAQDPASAFAQGKTGTAPAAAPAAPAAAPPPPPSEPPAGNSFQPTAAANAGAAATFGNTGETNTAQSHGIAYDSSGWNNANPTVGQSGRGTFGTGIGRAGVTEAGGNALNLQDLGNSVQAGKAARGGGISRARGGLGIVPRAKKPQPERVPVALSHGEYQVDPSDVAKIGGGNVKLGHAVLDHFVQKARGKQIEKLKKLKPPVGAKKAA